MVYAMFGGKIFSNFWRETKKTLCFSWITREQNKVKERVYGGLVLFQLNFNNNFYFFYYYYFEEKKIKQFNWYRDWNWVESWMGMEWNGIDRTIVSVITMIHSKSNLTARYYSTLHYWWMRGIYVEMEICICSYSIQFAAILLGRFSCVSSQNGFKYGILISVVLIY